MAISDENKYIRNPLPCSSTPQPLAPEDSPTFAGLTLTDLKFDNGFTAAHTGIVGVIDDVLNVASQAAIRGHAGLAETDAVEFAKIFGGEIRATTDTFPLGFTSLNGLDSLAGLSAVVHARWMDETSPDGTKMYSWFRDDDEAPPIHQYIKRTTTAGVAHVQKLEYMNSNRATPAPILGVNFTEGAESVEAHFPLKLTNLVANNLNEIISVGAGGELTPTGYSRQQVVSGMSTGYISGLGLTATLGTGVFTIAAGKYQIINNYTSPGAAPAEPITFAGAIDVPVTNLLTQPFTFIFLDVAGQVKQYPTIDQSVIYERTRDEVLVGFLNHSNLTFIIAVGDSPSVPVAYDSNLLTQDLAFALGGLNLEGNSFIANGTVGNLMRVDKTAGLGFFSGISAKTNPKNPNNIDMPVRELPTYLSSWQNGMSTGFSFGPEVTDINPGVYDDGTGGVGVPNGTVGNNEYTNFRFYTTAEGLVFFEYGQTKYLKIEDARIGRLSEPFNANPLFSESLFRTFLTVKGDATDLTQPLQAIFTQNPKLGLGGGGGSGAGAQQSLQDAYNNSPTPVDIILSSPLGGVSVKDSALGIGTPLWRVTNNAGSATYLDVSAGLVSMPNANLVLGQTLTVGGVTPTAGQWGFVGNLSQNLRPFDNVEFNQIKSRAQIALDMAGDIDEAKWIQKLGNTQCSFLSANSNTNKIKGSVDVLHNALTYREKVRFTPGGDLCAAGTLVSTLSQPPVGDKIPFLAAVGNPAGQNWLMTASGSGLITLSNDVATPSLGGVSNTNFRGVDYYGKLAVTNEGTVLSPGGYVVGGTGSLVDGVGTCMFNPRSGDPSTDVAIASIYSKLVGGVTHMFAKSGSGVVTQLT